MAYRKSTNTRRRRATARPKRGVRVSTKRRKTGRRSTQKSSSATSRKRNYSRSRSKKLKIELIHTAEPASTGAYQVPAEPAKLSRF